MQLVHNIQLENRIGEGVLLGLNKSQTLTSKISPSEEVHIDYINLYRNLCCSTVVNNGKNGAISGNLQLSVDRKRVEKPTSTTIIPG